MKKTIETISQETGYNFINNEPYISSKHIMNFEKYKRVYFEYIEKILNSKCIKDLIIKLNDHHKDINNIIKIDSNFINYIKNNTIFLEFNKENSYGVTNVQELKTLINIDFREINIKYNYNLLFIFCLLIITGLHEYIGHLLKDYFYYSTNFIISDTSPKKKIEKNEKNEEEEEEEEGGNLVEKLLFNKIKEIYIGDVLYILDIKNWEQNLDDFVKFLNLKKGKSLIKLKKKVI